MCSAVEVLACGFLSKCIDSTADRKAPACVVYHDFFFFFSRQKRFMYVCCLHTKYCMIT